MMKRITTASKKRYKRALSAPLLPEVLEAAKPRQRFNPDHQRVLLYEVHHALTRGLTVPETAALLDVKPKTVEELRDKAARMASYAFDIQTQEYVARKFWLSCEDRVSKLWELYKRRSTAPSIKVKCIALIHLIEQDMVKMGQSLGLIGKFDSASDSEMAAKAKALLERYGTNTNMGTGTDMGIGTENLTEAAGGGALG